MNVHGLALFSTKEARMYARVCVHILVNASLKQCYPVFCLQACPHGQIKINGRPPAQPAGLYPGHIQ